MSLIFQAVPERYDLRYHLSEGQAVAWVASRYRDHMSRGEIVYFWLAGSRKHRGIYGWGRITGTKPFVDDNGIDRIEVTCTKSFLNHPKRFIPAEAVQSHPVLQDILLFRNPVGTNFLLSSTEDNALRRLIAGFLGQEWLPPITVSYRGAADGTHY